MTTLTMTIDTQTNLDYDDVSETVKVCKGDLDGVELSERHTCPDTETEAQCKTEYKTFLTAKGYTWDTEA